MSSNLSDIQKAIVEAETGASIVTAGAGSGKTRVLTHRLAYLIQNGMPSHTIIALTFTNKAAKEMKHRVEDLTGGNCNAYLGTFHAWCARFLRKNIKEPYNSNFTIYDAKDSAKLLKEVGEDIAEYHKALEKSNAIDFDGLLELTLDLLKKDETVRNEIQDFIKFILVDEFQDTNDIQYKIVSILAGKCKNIMVVGDEDQCIYSWRGANIDNIHAFKRDFADCRVFKLEENFRSSGNIVSLANKLVTNNQNRLDKVLFSKLPDGKIEFKQNHKDWDEVDAVISKIVELKYRDPSVKYRDFGILMRINALTRSFEKKLKSLQIPYQIWGGFRFYDRIEVKGSINYLRVLSNPLDEAALIEILNFPKRGVGDSSVEKLRKLVTSDDTLFNVIMNIEKIQHGITGKALSGVKACRDALKTLSDIHDNFGLLELASNFVKITGLDTFFGSSAEEDVSRLANIYELVRDITVYSEQKKESTLTQFLQDEALASDTDAEAGDSVVISTVHSAKGLEFKNVFVVGLEEGIFPLQRSGDDDDADMDTEEERRLLYVAITRARENLFLHCASKRFFHGKEREKELSSFLYEMGFSAKTMFQQQSNNYYSSYSRFNNRYQRSNEWLD